MSMFWEYRTVNPAPYVHQLSGSIFTPRRSQEGNFLASGIHRFSVHRAFLNSSSSCKRCLRDLALSRLACACLATSMAFVCFWLER